MRDPYEILGVQKNATPAAVKSAFRRLAKKLHPDANRTDKAAATKFAELNAAYEIVGDEGKRKAFDRGEIDAEGSRARALAAVRVALGRGSRSARPGQQFQIVHLGFDGFRRRGGQGGGTRQLRRRHHDDILKEMLAAPPVASAAAVRWISAVRRRAVTSPAPSPSRCQRF
jgi:curved DNA-binding protein CbpA